jgi:hypothetical protein
MLKDPAISKKKSMKQGHHAGNENFARKPNFHLPALLAEVFKNFAL